MWKYLLLFLIIVSASCKKQSCADINCLNGGICINGECDCPERWTGDDCSTQITPRFIKVKNLRLNSFPENDEFGDPWDVGGDGPELTFKVTQNGSPVVYSHSQYLSNADHTVPNDFPISGDFILDPLEYYIFEFSDYDFSAGSTVIGTGRTVPIGIFNTDFPDTIYAEDGDLDFSILVEYEW